MSVIIPMKSQTALFSSRVKKNLYYWVVYCSQGKYIYITCLKPEKPIIKK